MVLPMPRPIKHKATGVYYLRTRVPSDLRENAKGRTVVLTVGSKKAKVTIGDAVKVSLQTKDWAEAKERFRIADMDLQAIWEGLRNGPVKLTNKQVFALAGRSYCMFAEGLENEPGGAARWQHVKAANAVVANGGPYGGLLISSEAKFKATADATEKLEDWRKDYNEHRPHGAIGNKVPMDLMKSEHEASPCS